MCSFAMGPEGEGGVWYKFHFLTHILPKYHFLLNSANFLVPFPFFVKTWQIPVPFYPSSPLIKRNCTWQCCQRDSTVLHKIDAPKERCMDTVTTSHTSETVKRNSNQLTRSIGCLSLQIHAHEGSLSVPVKEETIVSSKSPKLLNVCFF